MAIFDGKTIYDNENGDLPYGYLYISYLCGYFDGYSDGYFYWLVINHKWGYDWLVTGISGHTCGETKYPGSCYPLELRLWSLN